MHAGTTSSSQIGEVLAITLPNNAALGESTLTNAKLCLFSLAESRMEDDIESSVNITPSQFKKLVHSVDVVSSTLSSLKVFKDDIRSDLKGKIFEARKF